MPGLPFTGREGVSALESGAVSRTCRMTALYELRLFSSGGSEGVPPPTNNHALWVAPPKLVAFSGLEHVCRTDHAGSRIEAEPTRWLYTDRPCCARYVDNSPVRSCSTRSRRPH